MPTITITISKEMYDRITVFRTKTGAFKFSLAAQIRMLLNAWLSQQEKQMQPKTVTEPQAPKLVQP